MSIYYITAIDTSTVNNHTFISRVLIHKVENNLVSRGVVMGKDEVIALLNTNNVYTAIWNYTEIIWSPKESVSFETRNGINYLRSSPNNSTKDNLSHLLPLWNVGL